MTSMKIYKITACLAIPSLALQAMQFESQVSSAARGSCDQCMVKAFAHGVDGVAKGTSFGSGIFDYDPLSEEVAEGLSSLQIVGDGCIFEGFSESDAEGALLCKLETGSYPFPEFIALCPNDAIKSWEVTCDTECEGATCTVAEDPHIEVFDGRFISLLATSKAERAMENEGAGDKWLVKSKAISIQARYLPNDELAERNLFVRAIAVGGDFLKGNKMIISALEDESKWNEETILAEEGSTFRVQKADFFVDAVRDSHSFLVQDLSKENRGVTIKLPLGLTLIVNRLHKHVNVAIKMCAQEGGQEGLCGNNNGLPLDDSIEMSSKRFSTNVSPRESLFAEPI